MGYSMRVGNYRFTRWQKYENPDEVVAIELYDHSTSPMAQKNLAEDEKFSDKVKEFNKLLSHELAKYNLLKPQNR